MGVPGFYPWLKKKNKNNNNLIIRTKNKISSNTDYLLIDANALIHPVTKLVIKNYFTNNTDDLENKMLSAIIENISTLIDLISPNKATYIAIDGVVPLTKMKDQRQRRYYNIHYKNLFENLKKKYNEPLDPWWNSSAIAPGTKFMKKLHDYIIKWMKTTKYKIIYSSCYTPSEGEHKLLHFMKTNTNNNYIMFSPDADVIFLCLFSNANSIYILKHLNQELNINKEDNEYEFININISKIVILSTMKENIIKYNNNINIDKINNNNLINDFIFICYFLGNDFLPHIYALNIYKDGIEQLIINYSKTLQHIFLENNDIKYLIDNSNINLDFLKEFIKNLANDEENTLNTNYYNIKKKFNIYGTPYEREKLRRDNLLFKINDPIKLGYDNYIESRKRYYKYYWNIDNDEIENFSKQLVKHYLIGLKWVTNYYFDKINSWNWYYPYEYPPFLMDIYNYINVININKISFSIGKPLTPCLQLLSVLPSQSNYLLPDTLQSIPISDSDIIYLYPYDFDIDLINKKKYWMGIPILPQLDFDAIKNIFKKYKNKLTKEEKKINKILNIFYNYKKID